MTSNKAQDFLDPAHRLGPEDTFQFACGPDVPCFTECCGKLELLLTPYDVLRLKQTLRIPSAELLDRYAVIRWATRTGFPEVMMRMEEAAHRRCPFVTPQGCSVYENRPGACRIYPLGRASTKNSVDGKAREFFFTVREAHCRGFEQQRTWTVKEWLADQEISEYNRMNDLLMELFVLKARRPAVKLHAKHMQMYMMACYNVERFRDFVFQSGFLRKFRVHKDVVEQIGNDDLALLELSFRWLKFAFFQEPVLELHTAAL